MEEFFVSKFGIERKNNYIRRFTYFLDFYSVIGKFLLQTVGAEDVSGFVRIMTVYVLGGSHSAGNYLFHGGVVTHSVYFFEIIVFGTGGIVGNEANLSAAVGKNFQSFHRSV